MNPPDDLAGVVDGLQRRVHGDRFLLGICGAPGAGKSTVATRIADQLGTEAIVVPMDGFHLASSVIRDTPLARRRGAPDTFDGDGFVALLRRLRNQEDAVVYAPRYEREIEDPIACAIPVPTQTRIVLVEGNYLLYSEPPWARVPDLLDETWFVEQADDRVRIERLIARHVQFGKSADESVRWVQESDERNAVLITATRPLADLVLTEQIDGRVLASRP